MVIKTTTPSHGARLLSLGICRPAARVSNEDLAVRTGSVVDDDWVRARTGIQARYIAGSGESVVDMAAWAAGKALASAGLRAADVDVLILASCSLPSPMPNGAAAVAARLGATAGAFDLNAACSGFSYALAVADGLIRSGACGYCLVIGAERMTDWINWDDASTSVIFADGAGAAVLGPADSPGIGPVMWGSDGTRADLIAIPDPAGTIEMQGPPLFRWTVTSLPDIARRACEQAGVSLEDLAAFVPHQANLRIIDRLADALGLTGIPIARDIVTSGNTSAASIPLALAQLIEEGRIPTGSPVLLLGFGAGLTYSAQVVNSP